jgi:hypothetical protein
MRSVRPLVVLASLAVLAPSVVAGTPTSAWAQARKTTREQLPLQARGHWDAAVALVSKKDWDGARASFMAAYDVSKNPRVLFNVGVAEKELLHYAAALESFKRELAEGKGVLTPDEEREVTNVISGLQQFVAQLTIDVNEKDADIYIDNDRIDATKLPGPYTVDLGMRRVRAAKVGFAEAVETVQLAGRGSGKVTLKLQPLQRTARVNVSVVGPATAIVKIDGREVGPAPYAGQVNVGSEPHQFSAEANGYVTATQSALVKEGEALNLTLQLSAEQEKGKLIVLTKPEGATIEIDGKVAGASRWEGPVDARTHQVVVKKQGYYTWTHDVEVPKGGERSVTASLNEDRNTSFVPWMIGSIVIGAAVIAGITLLALPKDEEPQKGSLPPFVFGTTSIRPGSPGFHF